MNIVIPEPKLWSPRSPFLYDLKIALTSRDSGIQEAGTGYKATLH